MQSTISEEYPNKTHLFEPRHVELTLGKEICEVMVGAIHPYVVYKIALDKYSLLTIQIIENNTAGRCQLFVSTEDPYPTIDSATWMNTSSLPRKSITIFPADPAFKRGGFCFVAVRYVYDSGNSHFTIRARMLLDYGATWYNAKAGDLYKGQWHGNLFHGIGSRTYNLHEYHSSEPYNTLILSDHYTVTSQEDFCDTVLTCLDQFEGNEFSHIRSSADMIPLPTATAEVYHGHWQMGNKSGNGIYQWQNKAYVGAWADGMRNGKGILVHENGSKYVGEWRNDTKWGYGSQIYTDGTRHVGLWKGNKRCGEGTFVHLSGVQIKGTFEDDELVSPVVAKYADGTVYEGMWDVETGSRHSEMGTYTYGEHRYDGPWVHNKRHGEGVWTMPRDVKFFGRWDNDVRQPDGVFVFPCTDEYRGDWDEEHSVRQGHGTCTFFNKDAYTGNWEKDAMSGQGTMLYGDGVSRYDGEWAESLRHGKGTHVTPEGTYEGDFSDDFRHGFGKMLYADGSSYSGQWFRSKRHGFGEYYNAAEQYTYYGMFADDLMEGDGKAVCHQLEETYEGAWFNNVRHGKGKLHLPNGDAFTGVWENGQRLDGPGVCEYGNKDLYEGCWVNTKRHGKGICRFANGDRYEGEWKADQFNGEGTYYTAEGGIISCSWEEGRKKNSPGSLTFPDDSVYAGDFVNGKPHGKGRLVFVDGTVFEGTFEKGIYKL